MRRLNFMRPDRREVVALLGEEQAVEQRLDRVLRRRLAGRIMR
jgi:hypothetical protein